MGCTGAGCFEQLGFWVIFGEMIDLKMNPQGLVQRSFVLGALLFAINPPVVRSQSIQEGFSPDNYDTQIAKDILKALNDPASLKKVVVTFVNTSKAPLMCKMEVMPVYEQHMR